MMARSIRIGCWALLGLFSIMGLVWAQDSLADIEFLEFLANWSEEEQYWLDAELDELGEAACNPEKIEPLDGVPCTQLADEEEGSLND